jgi:energy-coupling factor transporter ATP-binding protein EcfA2
MSIYKDIINWATNKPLFIQDAIRRMLVNPNLTTSDIDELLLLLKKEVGYTGITINAIPATDADIPVNTANSNNITKLLAIENPVNINALWNDAKLYFSPNGLTLVYGKNGSGKSSYTRLLKKLCWSRHKDIELKKNIYTKDTTEQSVKISFDNNGTITPFEWRGNQNTHAALNSIYLFDSHCASIYLNSENVTEYKPLGIDLLEKLILLCHAIDNLLDNEGKLLTTSKPPLDALKYNGTSMFNWYSQVENKKIDEIESILNYTERESNRKKELVDILRNNNPQEVNKNLQQKISRYNTAKNSIFAIEQLFSEENRLTIEEFKKGFLGKKEAYIIAQEKFKGNDPLKGVGSETWRTLWEAAKKYAITEVHPIVANYPEAESAKTCVLCQQSLTQDAKNRLARFNTFITDETSKEFTEAERELNLKILELDKSTLQITDTFEELKSEIPSFEENLKLFQNSLIVAKSKYLSYLTSSEQDFNFEATLPSLSNIIANKINEIKVTISENEKLIVNRVKFEKELIELEALGVLLKNKGVILKYHQEYWQKHWINQCKSKINTRSISSKIGDILEDKAIELQHQEFITHLQSLNPTIASKVSIKKTRTSSGQTFQKCGFSNLPESLPLILSEGEQKIVALANFLSECTIDGITNTIIFDDPVNSLDQDYRESIAKKIVQLSLNRQIVVFTHDLYFLRLLFDIHKEVTLNECSIVGLTDAKGFSGIPSDEIPYLAKNVQQRIDTIRTDLTEVEALDISQVAKVEPILERVRQRMRKLLERAVEEILTNHTIQRFSKNINLKQNNLANLVVTEKSDIDFVLSLFSKYSITEHDGSTETIPIQPNETDIKNDLNLFSQWKDNFNERAKAFKQANGYR